MFTFVIHGRRVATPAPMALPFTSSVSMSARQIIPRPLALCDRLAVALLLVLAFMAAWTFTDYGLGWDDFTHSQYGELLYDYYASGLTDRKAFSFVNLYYYGGGFDLVATVLAKILPMGVFDIRRMLGAVIGLCGFVLVWRTGRRVAGPVGGLSALVLLAVCPLYYGHIFMNVKDAPFAVAVAGLVYALVRAFEEFPKPSPRNVAVFGLFLGLVAGTRVVGVMTGAYLVVAVLLVFVMEWRGVGFRASLARSGGFLLRLALGLPLAYAVIAVIWPWGVAEPLNPLRALEYYSVFWEVPWPEMFEGKAILVPNMPRSYVPTLFLVQMPLLFLGLALAGAAGAVVEVLTGREAPAQRARLVLLLMAGFFPIFLAVAMHPVLYNGIRHFVFVAPPLAILGGWAAARAWQFLATRPAAVRGAALAVFALGLIVPATAFYRLHPYEYTYYNAFAGGVRGAQDRFMLDYWGLAFKQAAEALNDYVEQHPEHLPKGRKIKVAVCGPHSAAAEDLGARYETTYDARHADFYLRLGAFYCTTVKAPVLVDIQRDGVTFAKVFDVRGRPFASVFADGS